MAARWGRALRDALDLAPAAAVASAGGSRVAPASPGRTAAPNRTAASVRSAGSSSVPTSHIDESVVATTADGLIKGAVGTRPWHGPRALWPNGEPIRPVQVLELTLAPILLLQALQWARNDVREERRERRERARQRRIERSQERAQEMTERAVQRDTQRDADTELELHQLTKR